MELHLLCGVVLVLQFFASCLCQTESNKTMDYDMDDLFTTDDSGDGESGEYSGENGSGRNPLSM